MTASKPKAVARPQKASIEQVLARFLERDEEHHSAWQAVTQRQADHGRMLEAVQVEVQRMARTLEAQAGINERQIALQETSATYGKTLERAFAEMKGLRDDFAGWKERHEAENATTRDHVTQARGGLKLLVLVSGIVITLLSILGSIVTGNINTGMDKMQAQIDRDKIAHDIKIDSLTQQVQEVRLDRQRDRETRENQP